jgi:hypothetical protein
VGVL